MKNLFTYWIEICVSKWQQQITYIQQHQQHRHRHRHQQQQQQQHQQQQLQLQLKLQFLLLTRENTTKTGDSTKHNSEDKQNNNWIQHNTHT